MDRYNHDLGGDDTDETDDSPLFGSFNSYSPQYRKQNSSRFLPNNSGSGVGGNNGDGDGNISGCSSGSATSSICSGVGSGNAITIQNDNSTNGNKTPLARPELRKLDVSFCFLFSLFICLILIIMLILN